MPMTPMGQYPYTGAPMPIYAPTYSTNTMPSAVNPAPRTNPFSVGYSYNQPQQQGFSINGRIVNDISEVSPNEVPMDRSISLFPLSDWSKIYARTWNSNGTIDTFTFVPDKESAEQPKQNPYDAIMARLDDIERKLDSRHSGKRAPRQNQPHKEMTGDES